MGAEHLLGGLLGLALFGFAGRVVLSFLPPGEPGYHRPARLPATWAASHLLGLVAFHSLAAAVSPFPLRITVTSFVALFALLAVVRWITLPAAMVPRAGRPTAPSGAAARVLLAALVLAVLALVAVALGPTLIADDLAAARVETKLLELRAFGAQTPLQEGVLRFVPPASLAALVVLVLHALESVGVGALARRAAVLVLLATPALWTARVVAGDDAVLLLLFGAGCSFALVWQRCADPRAMVLAAIGFAACAAYRPVAVPLGAAGIAVLCAVTHANARRSVLLVSCAALLLAFPPWHLLKLLFLPFAEPRGDLVLDPAVIGLEPLLSELSRLGLWGGTWVFGALAALAGLVAWIRRERATRGIEQPALVALLALALTLHVVVLVLQDVSVGLDLVSWRDALLHTLPAAALLVGLALGRR